MLRADARKAARGAIMALGGRAVAEWFRNATWDVSVAFAFEEKLRRARRKEQYLRIQASTLAASHPQVALDLLKRYFELPDQFDHAQAYVDRARALLALNRVDEAIQSYEAALAREEVFPNLKTQAYIDLPFLIATHRIERHYARAIQVLEAHKARLMFPVDRFLWHAASSLIAADSGDSPAAKGHAEQALQASGIEHSGFRYHPAVGLVDGRYDEIVQRLRACLAA